MNRGELVAALRPQLPSVLLALDFDGTLAPIVVDPTRSRPVEDAIATLQQLAALGADVAVITGRDARTALALGRLADVPGMTVLGLYGLESWTDGELTTIEEPPSIVELRGRLPFVVRDAATDDNVWIEDKRLSLVVHTRRAADPSAQLDRLRGPVTELARELDLEVHDGRDVIELRLPGYDKGIALRRLVDQLAPAAVLFAGDDVGDAPAFAVIRELREAGTAAWGIAVTSPEVAGIAELAEVSVASPAELVALLADLAN